MSQTVLSHRSPARNSSGSFSRSDVLVPIPPASSESELSEDEDGVFFGSHDPREAVLVAQLSSKTTPQRSALAPLRKRDSREFLRRQTLLLSSRSNRTSHSKLERTWPGGFRERQDQLRTDDDLSEEENIPHFNKRNNESSPVSDQHQCNLTFDFANFRLSDIGSTATGDESPNTEDGEEFGGSDKENDDLFAPALEATPKEWYGATACMTLKTVADVDDDAEVQELDMGGLRLDDLGDAESLRERGELAEEVDLGETSDEEPSDHASIEESEDQRGQNVRSSVDIPVPSPRPISPNIPTRIFSATPEMPSLACSTPDSNVTDVATDSPIPSLRGGPVVIPEMASHLAISMRAEAGSPYRSLPPASLPTTFPESTQDVRVALSLLASSPKPTARPPGPSSSSIKPTTTAISTAKASTKPALSTLAIRKSALSKAENSARLTIRGQLDSAFVGRLGPPQRSASGSSTASSSSTCGVKATRDDRVRPAPAASLNSSTAVRRKIPTPPLESKREDTSFLKRPPLIPRAPPIPSQSVRRYVPVNKAEALPSASTKMSSPSRYVPVKRAISAVPNVRSLVSAGGPSRTAFGPTVRAVPTVHTVFTFGDPKVGLKSPAQKRVEGIENQPRRFGSPVKIGTPTRFRPAGPSRHGQQDQSQAALPTRKIALPLQSSTLPELPAANLTQEAAAPNKGGNEDHDAPLHKSEEGAACLTMNPSSAVKDAKTVHEVPIEHPQIQRPRRVIKSSSGSGPSTAISEKELKAATQRNTAKNMVFHCAIDREIIRIPGPRPPSPTSKIRTTADKEEEERKAGRDQRAKRRSRGSDVEAETSETRPLIERVERTRGPGEDEDYLTPARPCKKVKTAHGKTVKWDRELTIIRNDGQPEAARDAGKAVAPGKSALKSNAQIELDRFGNALSSRPRETLKRQKIHVTAVFYEGEEPVPVADNKGKKK